MTRCHNDFRGHSGGASHFRLRSGGSSLGQRRLGCCKRLQKVGEFQDSHLLRIVKLISNNFSKIIYACIHTWKCCCFRWTCFNARGVGCTSCACDVSCLVPAASRHGMAIETGPVTLAVVRHIPASAIWLPDTRIFSVENGNKIAKYIFLICNKLYIF